MPKLSVPILVIEFISEQAIFSTDKKVQTTANLCIIVFYYFVESRGVYRKKTNNHNKNTTVQNKGYNIQTISYHHPSNSIIKRVMAGRWGNICCWQPEKLKKIPSNSSVCMYSKHLSCKSFGKTSAPYNATHN